MDQRTEPRSRLLYEIWGCGTRAAEGYWYSKLLPDWSAQRNCPLSAQCHKGPLVLLQSPSNLPTIPSLLVQQGTGGLFCSFSFKWEEALFFLFWSGSTEVSSVSSSKMNTYLHFPGLQVATFSLYEVWIWSIVMAPASVLSTHCHASLEAWSILDMT